MKTGQASGSVPHLRAYPRKPGGALRTAHPNSSSRSARASQPCNLSSLQDSPASYPGPRDAPTETGAWESVLKSPRAHSRIKPCDRDPDIKRKILHWARVIGLSPRKSNQMNRSTSRTNDRVRYGCLGQGPPEQQTVLPPTSTELAEPAVGEKTLFITAAQ